jgi:hypothetical protein
MIKNTLGLLGWMSLLSACSMSGTTMPAAKSWTKADERAYQYVLTHLSPASPVSLPSSRPLFSVQNTDPIFDDVIHEDAIQRERKAEADRQQLHNDIQQLQGQIDDLAHPYGY